ncbi:hypothetical protein EC991_010379 [Linnemannia zychae]|nr:hypothetical protein EC991_010379 [Linnemannia zychae]
MADKLHIRQHTIGEDDDSDTDQPVRKRTKYPEGLEAFESNTKDPNNTTLKESLEAWVSLHATEASASISRFSIAYNNQSANYITPMEPPLIPDTVANEISDVYPMNVQRPTVKTVPSTLQYRIETNQQLVHFNKPILHGQSLESDAKGPLRLDDADEHTCINTNGREHNQQYFHWLVANAVEEFIKDEFKGPTVISEVVFLGPFLGRHTYRRLLSCLTSKFERDIMLDVAILQALVQLIEGAPPGHLEDDDLIRTLAVLRRQIQGTHNTSAELVYQITTAISRFLDVMVNGMANKVNSTVVHQHLVAALRELMGTKNPILMLQAQYGLQALKYIMNDEPILQVILRFDGGITRTALGVASTILFEAFAKEPIRSGI